MNRLDHFCVVSDNIRIVIPAAPVEVIDVHWFAQKNVIQNEGNKEIHDVEDKMDFPAATLNPELVHA